MELPTRTLPMSLRELNCQGYEQQEMPVLAVFYRSFELLSQTPLIQN